MGDIGFLKIPHGGTYAGNVVATAAACATMDELEAGALDKVHAHGKRLMNGFNQVLSDRGVPGFVQGPPAMPAIVLTEEAGVFDYRDVAASSHDVYAEIIWKLFEKGVMPDSGVHEPWFISASHTDEDADKTIEAFDEAVQEVLG